MESGILRVGFGRAIITPTEPVHLSGGSDPKRISNNILDDMTVSCIAITDCNNRTVILMTEDMQHVTASFAAPAIEGITEVTGIPVEDIILCATHTHSVPTQNLRFPGVEAFYPIYKEGFKKAALEAMADRSPASVFTGVTHADGYVNPRHYVLDDGSLMGSAYGVQSDKRIVRHTYPGDTTIQLIRFDRDEKESILLMNLGSHATFNGNSAKLDLSADFPSPLRAYIEANSNCKVAYFLGAGGDQTPQSRFKAIAHGLDYIGYGEKIGSFVLNALRFMQPAKADKLQLKHMIHVGQCNRAGLERLDDAEKVTDIMITEGVAAATPVAKELGFASVYEARAIYGRSKLPETQDVELAVMSLGEVSFIFGSFEMFSDTGRYIREQSPFYMTFIATQALNTHSYIPSDIAFKIGCYEAYASQFQQGTAKQIADTYITALNEMK